MWQRKYKKLKSKITSIWNDELVAAVNTSCSFAAVIITEIETLASQLGKENKELKSSEKNCQIYFIALNHASQGFMKHYLLPGQINHVFN